MKNSKKSVFLLALPVAVLGLGFAGAQRVRAFADSTNSTASAVASPSSMPTVGRVHHEAHLGWPSMRNNIKPILVGTVTHIDGSVLTVVNKKTNATYTVDTTNAHISKGFGLGTTGASSAQQTALTVANIAVNDTVAVIGTLSGNAVVATNVIDAPIVHGTFAPHVAGKVVSVNGSSFTVQENAGRRHNESSVSKTITVNLAPNAVVKKNEKVSSVSDITDGEIVFATGVFDSTNTVLTASEVNIFTGVLTHTPKVNQ